ncbi:carboxypeptidase regulatory-like domain-containing protein [Mongoliitalea daihaiensis]|uniref:carboxypeptidase regulatory-like domain-containing protein n=1 Tax=Mongoliitalea daihaiensis TaxID=2782006 RepID=UPI001F22AA7B|nr:carboxypeptidase regulatory-like domain-containing protein [Mongoliitalea daihaiensis]UJP66707.1 carboxypeptidase regulatory-like domain-containing protein [Mongoliitalea daihaiensis]
MIRALRSRPLLALFVMIFFFACDEEQNDPKIFGQLTGIISNEAGMLIQGATVEIKNSKFQASAQTNGEGIYFFDRVPVGEYDLTLSATSYISSTISVQIRENVVNEKHVELQLGTVQLTVETEAIRVGIREGLAELTITSNTNWRASTPVSWISFETAEGQGDKTIKFTYEENTTDDIREAMIEVKAGTVTRSVKITQDKPIKIQEIIPVFGESISQTPASFDLVFSGPITILEIRPLINWCLPNYTPFTMNPSRTVVSYTYTCARAGGRYPFIIEYKDDQENTYVANVDVDFFDKRLSYDGLVIAKAMVPGEDKVWMLTRDPARVHLVDLKELKLERSITLSSNRPWSIAINPFNQLLYIGTQEGRILAYQQATGVLAETITLPPVPFQPHDNYYVNEMAFTTAGKAMMELYQVESSGITWFIMDSKQNHAISEHADKGWDAGQLYEILFPRTVASDKNLYFYGIGVDDRGLMKMDEQLTRFSTIASGVNDPMIRSMFADRTSERFVLHDGDTYIVDKGQRIDLGFIGMSGFNADFCRSCSSSTIALLAGIENSQLEFYHYGQKQAIKRFPTGGGSWRQFYHSLDGKEIVFESGDYDFAQSSETFQGKLIQIDMKRFNP